MTTKIKDIQYKKEFTYIVSFDDGIRGEIDFRPLLWGEAFEELLDINAFKQAFIDDITKTITWPNGVDIAPETLYKMVLSKNLQNNSSI